MIKEDEIAYLKGALEKSVEKNPHEDIREQHRVMLGLLDELEDGALADSTYPVFTATLDYLATGEGRTLIFLAAHAASMAEWLGYVCGKIGGYYTLGADLFEGLPPDDNNVFKYLVTPAVRDLIQSEIDPGMHGNLHIHFHQHVNYS